MEFALIKFVGMIVAIILFTIYCMNRVYPPEI